MKILVCLLTANTIGGGALLNWFNYMRCENQSETKFETLSRLWVCKLEP